MLIQRSGFQGDLRCLQERLKSGSQPNGNVCERLVAQEKGSQAAARSETTDSHFSPSASAAAQYSPPM